jgi:hypothetical protein
MEPSSSHYTTLFLNQGCDGTTGYGHVTIVGTIPSAWTKAADGKVTIDVASHLS